MKTVIILYASSKSLHIFDKVFEKSEKDVTNEDGTTSNLDSAKKSFSAFDMSLDWAKNICSERNAKITVLCDKDFKNECESVLKSYQNEKPAINLSVLEEVNAFSFIKKLSECAQQANADTIIFSWADCPFIQKEITDEILTSHEEFDSEYTFAEGYPYGFAPEVISTESCAIISKLCESRFLETKNTAVLRTTLFDVLKKDINSFEVETVLSDFDARLFRIDFSAGTKASLASCKAFFESEKDFFLGKIKKSADELSESACKNVNVLKTLPSYYNIQITDKSNSLCIYLPESVHNPNGSSFMNLKDFQALVKNISLFSECAVISLSAFGEALLHPDFVSFVKTVLSEPALSVLIETDGLLVTEELCKSISDFVSSVPERLDGGSNNPKIYWLITLDSVTGEMYEKIRSVKNDLLKDGKECLSKAMSAVSLLSSYFEGTVYAQFTRMNENESELEAFYRFWSDSSSPSKGNCIIQKYDSFATRLPERKVADLSPLERNPCWHIRRDVTILCDGSVPFCRACLKENIVGNAFTESLEKIWNSTSDEVKNQMNGSYCALCRNCDEYYTFNF